MAFLGPHFDLDIFVSYSHGDPRGAGTSPLKDWTHELIGRLESQILSLDTEFDDLNVWMDRQLDPTAHLTEELRAKVGGAGILMIVLSKRYLGSSWCRDELEWFRKQIHDRAGDQGRVFVLRAQPTDVATWPDFLRDERGHAMPGFSFFDAAMGLPYGWPDLKEPGREFVVELCRLQTAITKRLRELRDRAQRRAQPAERGPGALAAGGKRQIYLHGPSSDGARAQDLGTMLSQDGIVPVTAPSGGKGEMASWQKDSRIRIQMAKRCEAMALLRTGDESDRFEDDVFEIGVDERERIVSERGSPLPCAVLDRTGTAAPFELSPWDIEYFDATKDGWRGAFKEWLDAHRAASAQAAP